MPQSLMINNIYPKTDKEIGTVMSYDYHLTPKAIYQGMEEAIEWYIENIGEKK